MIRAYVPISAADLDALQSEGRFDAAHAVTVTPGVEALVPGGDVEVHEHIAAQLAAAAATSDPVAVCAFDVRPERVSSPPNPVYLGQFDLSGPISRRDIACFLVADAGEVVTDEAELEMSWFDATEVCEVRRLFA